MTQIDFSIYTSVYSDVFTKFEVKNHSSQDLYVMFPNTYRIVTPNKRELAYLQHSAGSTIDHPFCIFVNSSKSWVCTGSVNAATAQGEFIYYGVQGGGSILYTEQIPDTLDTIIHALAPNVTGGNATIINQIVAESGNYINSLLLDNNVFPSEVNISAGSSHTLSANKSPFQSSSIQGKGATLEENQYIKGLVYNNQDLLTGQNWTIPYGAAVDPQAVIETIEPTTVYGQVVPEGKYVKSFTWSGTNLFPATGDSPPSWTIPAESTIEPTVVIEDLPIPTTVTFDNTKLDSSKPYTNVYAVVTHSDGTSEALTNGYTFQDGDVISLAGTVYETPAPTFQAPKITAPSFAQDKAVTALMVNGEPYQTAGQQITLPEASLVTFMEKQIPPATVSLPVLPPGMAVTDYSLAGATQGQTAEIQAGSSQTLATLITPFEVTVNLDYTNTTVPVVQPLTSKGGDPDAQ